MNKSPPEPPTPASAEIETIDFGQGVVFRFCKIPAGTRGWVGSRTTDGLNNAAYGEEDPARLVVLKHDLWLLQTPVTQAQYRAVMASTGQLENPSRFKGDDRPVTNLSWWAALRFCNAFSQTCAGLTAPYQFDESGEEVLMSRATWDTTADGMRLPMEIEWELACRAGAVTEYFAGDGEQTLRRVGWFRGNSDHETLPVGHPPSSGGPDAPTHPFGLHDLHGNVWEWCWDTSGKGWDKTDAAFFPMLDIALRGGSFGDLPTMCRSAARYRRPSWYPELNQGFRPCLVRSPAGIRRARTEPASDQPAGPQAAGAGGAAPEAGGTVGWSEATLPPAPRSAKSKNPKPARPSRPKPRRKKP